MKRDIVSFFIALALLSPLAYLYIVRKEIPLPAATALLNAEEFTALQFTNTDPVEEARLAEAQRQAELEAQRQAELEKQRQQALAEAQAQQEKQQREEQQRREAAQQRVLEQKRIEKQRAEEKRIAEAKERERLKREKEKQQQRERERAQALAEKRRQERAEQQRQAQLEAARIAREQAAAAQQAQLAAQAAAAAQARAAAAQRAAQQQAQRGRDDAMAKYNNALYQAIARQSKRGRRANGRGKTLITFMVNADGRFSNIRVSRSSGNSNVDQVALSTVQSLGRFQPPPFGAQQFIVPVNFSEN